jgi:hypothetical protein
MTAIPKKKFTPDDHNNLCLLSHLSKYNTNAISKLDELSIEANEKEKLVF